MAKDLKNKAKASFKAGNTEVEDITKSAKKGDKEAQYNLAWRYSKGKASRKIMERLLIGSPNLRNKMMQGRSLILVGCMQKGKVLRKMINRLFIGSPNLQSKVLRGRRMVLV